MTLRIAFQMDNLAHLNLRKDSTLYLARAAAWHDCALLHYEPGDLRLSLENNSAKVTASCHELIYNEGEKENPWSLGNKSTVDLAECDAILMRQDPPFDLGYITATHILDHIRTKTRIVNDPTGVRNAPEKFLLTYFPELVPPTLITRDLLAISSFRAKHGDIIIKPLYNYGGRGVFHLAPLDDNLHALIEMLSTTNSEPWVIQKFLPVTVLGDKRILLLDGEPVGQFRRIPASGDIRGNMRVGARVESAPLTARDRTICATLAPVLKERGLRLVGLDVIGDYLTEINVTSPTGLITADELAGASHKDSIAEKFWQRVLS